jgi:CRP-like cAMP-binding protein
MRTSFHRLTEFGLLEPSDLAVVSKWTARKRQLPRNREIRRAGAEVKCVYFLLDGWVMSSVLLRSGRRQIVKVHLPGDMLGFPSLALETAGETLETITDATFCPIETGDLGDLFRHHPALATGLFLSSQKERVALMQELSWVGATSAIERLSAFLLDLHDRLAAAGLVEDQAFHLPLTQEQIGDVLGLTSVHVNRTLRVVVSKGLIERRGRQLKVLDPGGLRQLAQNIAPTYAGKEGYLRLMRPDGVVRATGQSCSEASSNPSDLSIGG